MKFLCCVSFLLALAPPLAPGQKEYRDETGPWSFEKRVALPRREHPASYADPGIDVTYYRLDLRIFDAPFLLSGNVGVTATSLSDSLTAVGLDLMSTMTVDSVQVGSTRVPFEQFPAVVLITLDRTYRRGEQLTVQVHYHGVPVATGLGSFEIGSHQGVPWVWSLSEPYGARDWWPCKDHPSDKADSVDIQVTCAEVYSVGSNGRLARITENGDGTHTFLWSERYPIATYLVSIALTNYASFSTWFHYAPGDSMEVLDYVLPEHLADAQATASRVLDMLRIFSETYGLYPFIREKYGHSEFGLGGAMEHQTMTSTTTFDEDVLAHELAHQWFGDLVTCATWSDVWLNEGFASYSEAVYFEKEYGEDQYWSNVLPRLSSALDASGSVHVVDTSDVQRLFAPSLVYAKGEAVLHMLRHVLGDSTFFRALRAYAADPALRFGSATTRDFQRVCETVAGTTLGYFFDEWVYGEGYPRYTYSWSAQPAGGGYASAVTITQSATTSDPAYFIMPVDFRFSAPGWDTTVILWNTGVQQQFQIPLSRRPDSAALDPDHWILREFLPPAEPLPRAFVLEQNFPNPFNAGTSISFLLPERTKVTLRVYDVLGREIVTLVDGLEEAGSHTVRWSGLISSQRAAASGLYYYRLTANGFARTKKLLIIR